VFKSLFVFLLSLSLLLILFECVSLRVGILSNYCLLYFIFQDVIILIQHFVIFFKVLENWFGHNCYIPEEFTEMVQLA